MQQLIGGLWKFAAVALALVPGIFGVVHWMVEAKSEAVNQRISYLERELDKGARFTAHDGQMLSKAINNHQDVHGRDLHTIRTLIDDIRFDDATFSANITNLTVRFLRIEDRIFAMDTLPNESEILKAPYKMPFEEFNDRFYPASRDLMN